MTYEEDVHQSLTRYEAIPEFHAWLVKSGWIDGSMSEMEAAYCAWCAATKR
jgi:hypothetical protein